MLNDPLKYQEQVHNFMEENCLTEENDFASTDSQPAQPQFYDKINRQDAFVDRVYTYPP